MNPAAARKSAPPHESASSWRKTLAFQVRTSDSECCTRSELQLSAIRAVRPETLWDLGANTGRFSRLAANRGIFTIAADIDPAAVEKSYLQMRSQKETSIHPLVMDLANPSPGIGWGGDERMSLSDRGPADTAMALALIHHLAISNNVPLDRVAQYFRSLCRTLIIEFVPKSDSQVQRLLSSREDIFPSYTVEGFETAFETCFRTLRREPVKDCDRVLYLLEAR
jgi:ribosomal protein L11 methylase PrmA